ncbi:MAG TPA: stage II sporulation protein M [Streptosporangiaceae bacterium]|nr:stage II sporulation protein M [Streptosporangiaceae bacterium]
MDVDAFVAAHQAEWDRLDRLVARRRRLTGDEVDELVAAYQRTATHLSQVRSAGYDPALAARLSTRLARARSAVTGAHTPAWRSVTRFATVSFPVMAYRLRWWWLATAAGSLLVAFVMGWWIARSPAVQAALLPRAEVRQLVNQQFRGYYSQYAAPSFAAKVWTNNAVVAGESLIFGILLGVPTVLVLLDNSANIAVDGGLMVSHGRGVEFFALILPHGMLELSAVFLAAAAGLRLGWKIIDSGPLPRSQALALEGRETITIAIGLVAVLLVSGVIEAFVTPSPLPTWARIGIGACAEAAFLGYVLVLGRRATAAGLSADIEDAPDVVPIAG